MPELKSIPDLEWSTQTADRSKTASVASDVSGWQLSAMVRWMWLGVPVIILVLTGLLEPGQNRQVLLPWLPTPIPETCGTYALFGLNCPGCGLTRAFLQISRGNWYTAWHLNPISLPLYAYVAMQIPLAAMRWIPDAPDRTWFKILRVQHWAMINQYMGIGLSVGLLLQWMIRLI